MQRLPGDGEPSLFYITSLGILSDSEESITDRVTFSLIQYKYHACLNSSRACCVMAFY